jgi:cell division transport system permease protein
MNRIIKNALKNIRRSPYQSLAAVMVLTISIFVTQMFIVLSYSAQVVVQYFETRPQVTAFFTDEVDEDTILSIKSSLESQSYVASATYVSKEEALKIYREQNSDDPLLLEMVTSDILPASLEVSATSVDGLSQIAQDLSSTTGVEEVAFQADVVDSLKKWTTGIRVGGITLVSILSLTSILIISIIISVKAATKRQEIATLRLLGASPWYINGPFVFEGALYGIVSSVAAWILTYILILYSTPSLVDFFGEIPLLPISFPILIVILGCSALFASLMGMVSGSLSTRRFGH